MKKRALLAAVLILALSGVSFAQGPTRSAEIMITFGEEFFEALLDAVFTHLDEPSVKINSANRGIEPSPGAVKSFVAAGANTACDESVRLKRVIDGVRTAVRFREGRIYAPIAFEGNYNPPLIGCVGFQGWAETNIELSYDTARRALVGNAKVRNVRLSGAGGAGGGLIARLVQGSIDRKVNPIEIVTLDKLSFTFPVKNSGRLAMRALSIRHIVADAALEVYVRYEFVKAK